MKKKALSILLSGIISFSSVIPVYAEITNENTELEQSTEEPGEADSTEETLDDENSSEETDEIVDNKEDTEEIPEEGTLDDENSTPDDLEIPSDGESGSDENSDVDEEEIINEEVSNELEEIEELSEEKGLTLSYRAHVSNIGWQDYIESGMIGTTGKNLPMEAFEIEIQNVEDLGIRYAAHVSNIGWQDYVSDGEMSGTTGKALAMEAIKIELTGSQAEQYDIYYRAHVTNAGWLDWAKNGEAAGSQGYAYSLQALEIQILPKDSAEKPTNTANPFIEKIKMYQQAHVSNVGWQPQTELGSGIIGTTGKNLALEALKLSTSNPSKLSIEYRTHVRNIGWQDYVSNGELAGTTGKALCIEAVQIRLSGSQAEQYDIYYRAHVANVGWLDWAKNDQEVGSSGLAYGLEALEIVLVKKGGAAPGATSLPYLTKANVTYRVNMSGKGWQDYVSGGQTAGITKNGSGIQGIEGKISAGQGLKVQYATHVSNIGWQNYVSEGQTAGSLDSGNQIEAVKFQLSGAASKYYDIWYRVYTDKKGWMGWTSNGQAAGTEGYAYPLQGIEVVVRTKGSGAPGSTANAFDKYEEKQASKYAKEVLNQVGWNLRAAFNWSSSKIKYKKIGEPAAGLSHLDWYAEYGFKNKTGNCYVMAATFCWMAKELGYEAYLVEGSVPSRSGGMTPHGWCELVINGTTYVFDPDFTYETGRNGYQITYGASGTWRYSNYKRVN